METLLNSNRNDRKDFKHSIYMSSKDGFVYDINTSSPTNNPFSPLIYTAKYFGEAPIEVNYNFSINNNSESGSLTITPQQSDSLLAKYWAGQTISYLQDEDIIDTHTALDILETSLEHRVLSMQTAFLALDPALGIELEACEDCTTETNRRNDYWLVATDEATVNSPSITVSPNPIGDIATVRLNIGNQPIIMAGLYTISGQLIQEFEIDETDEEFSLEIEEKGVYFLIIKTEKQTYTVKVMK